MKHENVAVEGAVVVSLRRRLGCTVLIVPDC